MFGPKRSGIPVPGSTGKSSIPLVKKTARTSQVTNNAKSNIPNTSSGKSSPERQSLFPSQASKMSDFSGDSKSLKTQIINLQKELDEKEGALQELSSKLAMKSEECRDLMEERDTMRERNSLDLQQVTQDYLTLQEKYKKEQSKTAEREISYKEEQERLQLELDVSKGEHELELSMLRKEIIDIRNKSQQRGLLLDVETDRLKNAEYECEIQRLKSELQEQTMRTKDVKEKLEQQEFEVLELNEMKKQYQRQIEVIAAEHQVEVSNMRQSFEKTDGKDGPSMKDVQNEHETNIRTLTELHEADMKKLMMEFHEEKSMKEKENADIRAKLEAKIKTLNKELKQSGEKNYDLEKRHQYHMQEIEDLRTQHEKEIQRIQCEHKSESERETNRSTDNELQVKRQMEAYEHEIRSLKADLKKERLDFTEARELLENSITEMENEMKEREEKVRYELREEHKYELENLIDEHEQLLHEKQKANKQEIAELKKIYEAQLSGRSEEDEKIKTTLDRYNALREKELQEVKAKYDNEIEHLQERLESLQLEHEDLQREYDLVVNDLEGELEMTKLKVKGSRHERRNSGALMEGIEKLKTHNEEHVQHLTSELKEAQSIISSLNSEISVLKTKERTSLEHLEKVTQLEALVKDLELGSINQDELMKELSECKLSNDNFQNELNEVRCLNLKLQTELDCVKKDKEREVTELENIIEELTSQTHQLEKEQEDTQKKLAREVERLKKEKSERQQEANHEISIQRQNYNEKISNLDRSIEELTRENQKLKGEIQELQDEVNELKTCCKSDSHIIANDNFDICAESIEMIGQEAPEPTEELKYDQRMKAIVEEFENKADDLQKQLNKANHELTTKNSKLKSLASEMNVSRENLDNERSMVQNLEERYEKLLQNQQLEIETIKKKYENGAEQSAHESVDREARIKQECDQQVEIIRKEFTDVYDENKKLAAQLEEGRRELEVIRQRLLEQDAKHVADTIKQAEASQQKTSALEEELNTLRYKLECTVSNVEDERSEHKRKVHETEFLLEQLKQSESNSDHAQNLVNEVQELHDENRALRIEFANKKEEFSRQVEKLQKEGRTQSAEIESLAAMVDSERSSHKEKMEQFENEVNKRDGEVKMLNSLLEKEQANHEQTIRDTQRHISKLRDLESNNDKFNRENLVLKTEVRELKSKNEVIEQEVVRLKSKVNELEAELSKVNQDNGDLLNRSKKIAMDEMEQVQKLNRSLTQSEIHNEQLLGAVENSKQELQKAQEKYQKTKDKLKTVTQKWHKDHSKLEEILLSPRVEMGLQTSLMEPKDLENIRDQLSNSMKKNSLLQEQLKDSKKDLSEFRNDIQATKRANNVLIKQNQVLYLETESLKKTIDVLTEKADQLREVSLKLSSDNEKFQRENSTLKEKLESTELSLSQIEGERHSYDEQSKSSTFELEEQKTTCRKIEQEKEKLKNQNDFLLSQAKRLQNQVDELESIKNQLTNDLLTKEVELLKKERMISGEVQETKSETALMATPNSQGLQKMNTLINPSRDQGHVKEATITPSQAMESSVGPITFNDDKFKNGDKGYFGVKSFQVIEWDLEKEPDKMTKSVSFDSSPLTNIKQFEFDSSNYLGSAYWDTMNLLKTMKSSK